MITRFTLDRFTRLTFNGSTKLTFNVKTRMRSTNRDEKEIQERQRRHSRASAKPMFEETEQQCSIPKKNTGR